VSQETVTLVVMLWLDSHRILFSRYNGNKKSVYPRSCYTEDFSSVRLATEGKTYPQRCFRGSVRVLPEPVALIFRIPWRWRFSRTLLMLISTIWCHNPKGHSLNLDNILNVVSPSVGRYASHHSSMVCNGEWQYLPLHS
jgi:hypothetical protein